MGIKRIHVIRPAIQKNLKCGSYEPVISVKSGGKNIRGHVVIIYGEDGKEAARVIQPKDKKLGCGARVWIETKGKVDVISLGGEE